MSDGRRGECVPATNNSFHSIRVYLHPGRVDGGTILTLPRGLFTQSQEVDNGFTAGNHTMTERVLRRRGGERDNHKGSIFCSYTTSLTSGKAVKRSLPSAWVTGADASTTAATQGGHPS